MKRPDVTIDDFKKMAVAEPEINPLLAQGKRIHTAV